MEWLNEPASWQRTGDVLTVSVDPGTDFWCETGYGYLRDSGHVYGEVLAGDFDVSVRVHGILEAQFDQAGVMLRADERTWLKTGMEFFEGRPRLSTVLTLGRSSWTVTDLPAVVDDIVLRVSRRGDAVEVRYLVGGGPEELAALVFLPPGREVLAGVMCAAPDGPGFRVSFHDLRIIGRDWSGRDDAARDTAWREDGPAGPTPAEPGPDGPALAEPGPDGPAPAEPGPGGPAPAEPRPEGPTLAAPGPAGPTPAEPGPAPAEPGPGGPTPAEPAPARRGLFGREARRGRTKEPPTEPPAEPDAADEWISLLTADPDE